MRLNLIHGLKLHTVNSVRTRNCRRTRPTSGVGRWYMAALVHGNLLRTPLLLQISHDHGPVCGREALIATGSRTSPTSEVIGRGGR